MDATKSEGTTVKFKNPATKQKLVILGGIITITVLSLFSVLPTKALDEPWVKDLDSTEPGRIMSHPDGDVSTTNCSSKKPR